MHAEHAEQEAVHPPSGPPPAARLLTRLTVLGMLLAVLALGALAVWSAVVTQRGAA